MTEPLDFGDQVVWRPSPEYIDDAHLTRFMRQHGIADFDELITRSTKDIAWFTESLLNYLDIQFYEPYSSILDLSDGIAWPRWCVDGKMNIVHNCLDKYTGTPVEDRTAVIWEGEDGGTRSLSYGELNRQVNQAANALRFLGLGKGDAIGIYMPMTPEIVVALLAIAKIGAIILPLFSGYGVGAVVTRLADADAKALFTADGFYRRGKPIAMKPIADQAASQVPTLLHMIVLNYSGLKTDGFLSGQGGVCNDNDEVARAGQSGRCAVHADRPVSISSFNVIRGKALAIGNIVDLHLFPLEYVRRLHQCFVDGDTAFIADIRFCHGGAVDF